MKFLTFLLSISLLLNAQTEVLQNEEFVQQPITIEEIQLPPPAIAPKYKSPLIAVGLSCVLPGSGHYYLDDPNTATGLLGSASIGLGLALREDLNASIRFNSYQAMQMMWSYGVYAAYRDVRTYNGQMGYKYQMPRDNLADLSSAPFRFSVLKKPEVWGGFLGAMAIAMGVTHFLYPKEAHIQTASINLSPLCALPVGVGEECLFRGYLQSQLSEGLSPLGGLIGSSLAFGAAHIPNAFLLPESERWRYFSFSLPMITAFGAYFGWITQKNNSLKESVALHTWYDFTLMALSAWVAEASTGQTDFYIAVPF